MSSADPAPGMRTSERIYRMLLHAYPSGYRRQYGPLMAQAFRDLAREAYRHPGVAHLVKLWMNTLTDVATTAAVEHVDVLLNRATPTQLPPPSLAFHNVYKSFPMSGGKTRMVLCGIDLMVHPGEFVAVVGPTGSGKSTMLSLVAGLDKPTLGQVLVMGQPLQEVSRRVGYIFQTDALFPWKNVLDNVICGPLFRGMPKDQALVLARDWLHRVGLSGFEKFYPYQLSGGMRKRVALAQSLIIQPDVLLLDEPFGDLDAQMRTLMEDELLELWASTEACVLYVTHDLEEAIALADRVVVLTAGPATIKGIYPVDIPRPRRASEVRFMPHFTELYREIWEDLRSEVTKSYESLRLSRPLTVRLSSNSRS